MKNGDRYRYGLKLHTGPAAEPITLTEAKKHLYEDDTHNDAEINQMITEARKWVEEQTDAQLITATWTMTLDRFPDGSKWLVLPRWPVTSVEEIRYTDASGQSETLDLQSIVTRLESHGRARIARAQWQAWPSTLSTPDAVAIDFECGYGGASDVHETFKRAMLLLIGHWYENRSAVEVGTITKEVEFGVNALLEQMRPADELTEFDLG